MNAFWSLFGILAPPSGTRRVAEEMVLDSTLHRGVYVYEIAGVRFRVQGLGV